MTRLEIVSDVVCPWCYLGAANLLRALADRGRPSPFAMRWRPFRLDPTLPPEGIDRGEYLAGKFGDRAGIEAAHARIAEMGREVGLAFRFDLIRRAPSSLDAHRLIRWAEPEGLQTRTAMALFARYFEQGEDISDPAVLRAAAKEAGMDAVAVARLLAGDADRDEVAAEAREMQALGVTGVPTFLVGGRYAVSGAQPPDLWMRLADEIDAAAGTP
jgi:predicted DsbA family dithiol-disulfide isomerase